tara:strand:- start:10 stop:411 length:402 start_codon:yes stop_codon:yes gene_type:complete
MTKEKKDKKAKTKPTEAERIIEAYYMLARVIDHNTQMLSAFVNMISDKEAEDDNPISPPKIKPVNVKEWKAKYTKEDITKVLHSIHEKCGKEKAIKFLDSFDAKTLSQVAPANYDVFVTSGEYMVKQYGGDPI